MSARYAVFFCPEDSSPLAQFGQQVLGRSADGDTLSPRDTDFPDDQQAKALSATPAHYGFHATLKAPFELSAGSTERQLLGEVEVLARQQSVIAMPLLRPRALAGFMALTFDQQPDAITTLAQLCVRHFEPFRAPISESDILRRKPAQLSDRQREYLYQYGYPYVMNEFRFHMSLTGSMVPADHADYVNWLSERYDKLVREQPVLDRLAVFWQADRATPFTRLAQFSFIK